MLDQTALATVGFALIFCGFAITFLAVLAMFVREVPVRRRTRGGGIIMIGPVPIVFGTDKETVKTLLILAVVLMILALALMFLPRIGSI